MEKYAKKPEATYNRIVNMFFQLYTEKPISQITVQEIADGAGVHRATFYRYFDDVYALLQSEENRIFEAFQQSLIEPIVNAPDEFFDTMRLGMHIASFYSNCGDNLFVLLRKQEDGAFRQRVKQSMESAICSALQISEQDISKHYLVRFAIAGILETVVERQMRNDISLEELIKYMHPLMSAVLL